MQVRRHPLHDLVNKLFQQPRRSWAVVMALSCFDLSAWLAIALLCLFVLRQGIQRYWNLICASFLVHALSLYWHHPDLYQWIRAFNDYWPALVGACALMYSRSWYWTLIAMLCFVLLSNVLIDFWLPDYGAGLLNSFFKSLAHYSQQAHIPLPLNQDIVMRHQNFLAPLFLGVENMMVIFNAFISLSMARSLQAQLFNPQGFLYEMLNLRGSPWLLGGCLFGVLLILGFSWNLPLYALPTVLMYLVGVGLSISVAVLTKNRVQTVLILLVVAAIVLPYIFLPCFLMMGFMDSLIDLRLIIAKKLKYTF